MRPITPPDVKTSGGASKMSALPVPISLALEPTKSPPAPRGVGFIPLSEACHRSGKSPENLAWRCRGEWASIGLAAILKPEKGGKACWHVREDADPLFARVKSPWLVAFDWKPVSASQRDEIHRRKRLIDAWMEARIDGFDDGLSERHITAAFVTMCRNEGDVVSRETLFRWLKGFNTRGFAGLTDARRDAQVNDPNREAFVAELKRRYLAPNRRSAAMCYELAVDQWTENGQDVPFDKRRAQQILNDVDRKVKAFHREGPRAYDAKFGKFLRGEYTALESNEMWVSDGHELNVMVRVPGREKPVRPIMIGWFDVRSRKLVGWRIVAGSENSDVILAAFKSGVKTYGMPESVYHDNGEAYDAQALQGQTKRQRQKGGRPQLDMGLFPRLGITVKHSLPYNAKAKIIE